MNLGTLARYLLGDVQAIRTIAQCNPALWLGLIFVLSAGLAREYDGEDLLSEPWHAIIPVAASLVTSFVLFLLLFFKVWLKDPARPRFFTAYRSFLTLYWLTAPLAWLYAVPYERFLSAPASVQANLWTLALVAFWRVVLMIRVASVLMGYSIPGATGLVLLFADAVAQTVMALMPLPIVSLMGGVRLSESDQIIRTVTCCIQCWGILLLPIVGISALITLGTAQPKWAEPTNCQFSNRVDRSLWIVAISSVVVWTFILPITQPEQQLRRHVEVALRAGQLELGINTMMSHDERDFPPHWDPPPRIGYPNQSPPLLDVVELLTIQPTSWIHTKYSDKLRLELQSQTGYYRHRGAELLRLLRAGKAFEIKDVFDAWWVKDFQENVIRNNELVGAERIEIMEILNSMKKGKTNE